MDYKQRILKEFNIAENIVGSEKPNQQMLVAKLREIQKQIAKNQHIKTLVTISYDACYFIERVEKIENGPPGTVKLNGILDVISNEDEPKNVRVISSGFAFVLNFVNIEKKSELLYFLFTQNGHTNATVLQTLEVIKEALQLASFKVYGYSFDADTTNISEHVKQFFPIIQKRYTTQCLEQIIPNKGVIPHVDNKHQLKNQKYSITSNLKVFNVTNLDTTKAEIIDLNCINKCLKFPDYMMSNSIIYKMRDDLAINLFCPFKAYDVLYYNFLEPGIYWMLMSPLLIGVVEGDQKGLLAISVLCLKLYVKLYNKYQSVEYAKNVGQKKTKNKNFVQAFSDEQLMYLIIYTASLLKLVNENDYVNIVALGSYACECFFGRLRYQSYNDNTAIKAEHVIENQLLIEYLNKKFGAALQSKGRLHEYTNNLTEKFKISEDEENYFEDLSERIMQYIFAEKYDDQWISTHDGLIEELMQLYEKLEIQNLISLPHFRRSDNTIEKLSAKNYERQGRQSRMFIKQAKK